MIAAWKPGDNVLDGLDTPNDHLDDSLHSWDQASHVGYWQPAHQIWWPQDRVNWLPQDNAWWPRDKAWLPQDEACRPQDHNLGRVFDLPPHPTVQRPSSGKTASTAAATVENSGLRTSYNLLADQRPIPSPEIEAAKGHPASNIAGWPVASKRKRGANKKKVKLDDPHLKPDSMHTEKADLRTTSFHRSQPGFPSSRKARECDPEQIQTDNNLVNHEI
ncbi:hypothetical protein PCASD_03173 [Puccinia coronata f. sp. avenae]|uniref:Uncharacterized protein n=1 Tax=Puccinia coronata f. sp. avenae TaxID=200324 RepID=A0A2N5VFK9_9BASI|nr:hypothetical protein PCASD_03173 [Puccinia coronata f. sp. avenae]